MAISCVICNSSLEKDPDCLLFSFPDKTDYPVQYQKYLTVCDIQEASLPVDVAPHICATHFNDDCFDEEGNLIEGSLPSANLERIEIEAYADEDFQMLEEYEPLFNVKPTATVVAEEPIPSTSEPPAMETETLLVPKTEPVEIIDEVIVEETEIKTEAPEVDEGIPDPFDNVKPAEDGGKFCVLCSDSEEKNPDCRLFVFPKKIPRIYRKWMLAAKLDMAQYQDKDIYSCQNHFPENGFFADGKFVQSWATPKLNLPAGRAKVSKSAAPSEPQMILLNAEPGPSSSGAGSSTGGPQIVIKVNPANRKNAEALNIDPDSYAKTFAKVVMDLMPRKLNYNGEERPVTGTIVFQSNLF